ncbi:imidazole glycerol phosphate synthase subunit HisH [Glaciecola petra]|uniref:Imidazole glycerol phosphate synthase subunit HisH n=1 Tax=Glaciecola petra TaxID=3075602 RepID=A0ABU2ZM16_9ALTE|nr:imidazole glycerol phosphate synthase subunit HisH [Aestuariibacter sp. P117]MDT0593671.1 imidazole glycerol phosphate synthase subunit HisH [Aestuariibacter sp. P117]
MIAIIDYGLGNVQAIVNIYKKLKIPVVLADIESKIEEADSIILPGVGAFDEAMLELDKSGLRKALDRAVLEDKKPTLGICVGMQIMAQKSDEGAVQGLGWFDACVKKFDDAMLTTKPKLPHMGWNSIKINRHPAAFEGVDVVKGFYFLHSYYFHCENLEDVVATSIYGNEFACVVQKENIYGFQFHPEKSHSNGESIFKNFANVKNVKI